jgi:hypothetical protein
MFDRPPDLWITLELVIYLVTESVVTGLAEHPDRGLAANTRGYHVLQAIWLWSQASDAGREFDGYLHRKNSR